MRTGEAEKARRVAIAEAVRIEGESEAAAVLARGNAEAEAMQQRAEAFSHYNEAAVLELFVKILPEVARELASPMASIDSLTVLSTDGAAALPRQVTENLAQTLQMLKGATGVDLQQLVQRATRGHASPGPVPGPAVAGRPPRAARSRRRGCRPRPSTDPRGQGARAVTPGSEAGRHLLAQADACARLGSPLYARVLRACASDLAAGGPVADVLSDHLGRAAGRPARAAAAGRRAPPGPRPAAPPGSPGSTRARAGGPTTTWCPPSSPRSPPTPTRSAPWLDRAPQTNEVGRTTGLVGALLLLLGGRDLPVVLHEVGASAGLGLHGDRYRHQVGAGRTVVGPRAAPRSRWPTPGAGRRPTSAAPLHVVERHGSDVAPVDLAQPGRGRPAARLRLARPDRPAGPAAGGAASSRRSTRCPVRRARGGRGGARLALREGHLTVLWHSVMWQYLPPPEQRAAEAALAALGAAATAEAPLARVSLEPAGALAPGAAAGEAEPAGASWCGPRSGRAARPACSGRRRPTVRRSAGCPEGPGWWEGCLPWTGDLRRALRPGPRPTGSPPTGSAPTGSPRTGSSLTGGRPDRPVVPTAVVAAGSLVVGFAVAQATDVRALGGVVLLAGAAWCGRHWARRQGPVVAGALLAAYAGGFVGSHVLAREIGAWPSVLTVAGAVGVAAWVVSDRRG